MRFFISCLISSFAVLALSLSSPAFADEFRGGGLTNENMSSPIGTPSGTPQAARIHDAEGSAAYAAHDYAGAEHHWAAAVQAGPNVASLHYNYAIALDKNGKHKEATAEFKEAKRLGPENRAIISSVILKKHLSN
jgi:tetratricopeptide (TPR) repeat protein